MKLAGLNEKIFNYSLSKSNLTASPRYIARLVNGNSEYYFYFLRGSLVLFIHSFFQAATSNIPDEEKEREDEKRNYIFHPIFSFFRCLSIILHFFF